MKLKTFISSALFFTSLLALNACSNGINAGGDSEATGTNSAPGEPNSAAAAADPASTPAVTPGETPNETSGAPTPAPSCYPMQQALLHAIHEADHNIEVEAQNAAINYLLSIIARPQSGSQALSQLGWIYPATGNEEESSTENGDPIRLFSELFTQNYFNNRPNPIQRLLNRSLVTCADGYHGATGQGVFGDLAGTEINRWTCVRNHAAGHGNAFRPVKAINFEAMSSAETVPGSNPPRVQYIYSQINFYVYMKQVLLFNNGTRHRMSFRANLTMNIVLRSLYQTWAAQHFSSQTALSALTKRLRPGSVALTPEEDQLVGRLLTFVNRGSMPPVALLNGRYVFQTEFLENPTSHRLTERPLAEAINDRLPTECHVPTTAPAPQQ